MKKLNKVLSVIMVVLMLACISTNVFAANKISTGALNLTDITSNQSLNSEAGQAMAKVGGTIVQLVTNVGMILAIVVIAILGVKYMMGSTEEKAEYKKAMLPYLIGAFLVFGASTVAKFVIGFAGGIS